MHKFNLFSVICLAGCSWALLMVGHELIGHGGAVFLFGGDVVSVDAMYLSFDFAEATFWQDKIIRAAGSIINILFVVIAYSLLTRLKQKSSALGLFYWFVILMNCFQAGSYIIFGRFIDSGMDWAMFLNGMHPLWLWKVMEFVLGATLIGFGIYIGLKYQYAFLSNEATILKQKLKLFLIPFFTATILSILASAVMPTDDRILMIWGGFGNSFMFLFGMFIMTFIPINKSHLKQVSISKPNTYLLFFSLLIIGFYLIGMSPGINF